MCQQTYLVNFPPWTSSSDAPGNRSELEELSEALSLEDDESAEPKHDTSDSTSEVLPSDEPVVSPTEPSVLELSSKGSDDVDEDIGATDWWREHTTDWWRAHNFFKDALESRAMMWRWVGLWAAGFTNTRRMVGVQCGQR